MSKQAYGVTEVFLKHQAAAAKRIRLFDKDGRIYIDEVDRARATDVIISIPKKINPASRLVSYENELFYAYCGKDDFGAFPRFKYIIHEGSSRSSKSWSLEEWSLQEAEQKPNLHINIWRDSREALTDTIWKDFRKLIPLSGRTIRMNKNTTPITFANGSMIVPKGADQTNAHGTTQDIAWLNEPYNISEDEFDQIDQRSNQVIIDINPLGITWAEKLKKNPRTKVVYSTFKNNPFCPADQKRKILGYEPWEPGSYHVSDAGVIMYNGKPVTETNQPPVNRINYERQTINVYKWIVYGLGLKAENPRKIHHNFRPMSYIDYQKISGREYQGIDYGSVNPSAFVKIKYDGDRTFYILPSLYKPINKMSRPLGEELIAAGCITGDETIGWADSADNDPGSDLPMTNALRQNYSINVIKTAKPSYKARFEFMANALFFFVSDLPERSPFVDGDKSLSQAYEYELDNYQWEYINDTPTGKPVKKHDHFMNATEYCVWGIKQYLDINL